MTDKNCCMCNPKSYTTSLCEDCKKYIDEIWPLDFRRSKLPSATITADNNIPVRTFESGATRDSDLDKFDYEGFLSPLVIKRFGKYMHKHRIQSDGSLRNSDNWQLGIPLDQYMKSGYRHFIDWWSSHREIETEEELEDSLCALIFNANGYLFELLKSKSKNSVG